MSLEATVVAVEDWLVDSFTFCQHWASQIRGFEGSVWRGTVKECRGMGEQGLEMLNYSFHHTASADVALFGGTRPKGICFAPVLFLYEILMKMSCSICHHHDLTTSVIGCQWIQ